MRDFSYTSVVSLLVLAMMSVSFVLYSQTPVPVSAQPYFCDFENLTENAEWSFDSGTNTSTWVIDTALNCGMGANSLYISGDGGRTAGFDARAGYVVAYRDFILDGRISYDVSFDWQNPSSGKMYVCWIDPSANYPVPPAQWSGSGNNSVYSLPDYVIHSWKAWTGTDISSIHADTLMSHSSRWQKARLTVSSRDNRPMRLLFFWMNDTKSASTKHGGAIDNIQIGKRPVCVQQTEETISEVQYNKTTNGNAEITWKGGLGQGETYELWYREESESTWVKLDSLKTPSASIPELPVGGYVVWIRMHCFGVTSIWYMLDGLYVREEIYNCLDYLNIYDSTSVHATYGTFADPYQYSGVINEGSGSMQSRLTIHYGEDEYDNRTECRDGTMLKTVPEGYQASIRLGNWNTGGKAESVTYDYMVDSLAVLMVLQYAIVMEDPKHKEVEQPKFKLEILDSFGKPFKDLCYAENFTAGYGLDTTWHTTTRSVMWKDWSGFGLNLSEYAGKRIKIRLTTYDCDLGGHYGYAYFTLNCARAELSGVACGENTVQPLTAPNGFTYEWFPKGRLDSIVSRKQSFEPLPSDTGVFVCRMTYKGGKCSFDLEASIDPKYAVSEFKPTVSYKDCKAVVKMKNTSHTMTGKGIRGECESFLWEWGDGQISKEKELKIEFEQGGMHKIALTSYVTKDQCPDVYVDSIYIPEFGSSIDTVFVLHCANAPRYEFNDVYYSKTGIYKAVDKKSVCDCDSITYLDFKVIEVPEEKMDAELFLYKDEYYDFNGRHLTETGIYIDTLSASSGCDSIVTLHLTAFPSMNVEPLADSILVCAGETELLTFDYSVKSGSFTTYSLIFDKAAQTAGFENQDSVTPVLLNVIEIPIAKDIRPNVYQADLVFDDYYSGRDTLPVRIVVNYSSKIMAQKWNDVIALYDAEYNGGYTFSGYQWYKNGEPLFGETKSYIYVPGNLDMNAEYTVKLTRSDDEVRAFACPVELEERSDISLYPAIVSAGETITIKTTEKARVEFWNVMGLKVGNWNVDVEGADVMAPQHAGTYFVFVKLESGGERAFSVLVK